jgi:hypothetical protein
MLLMKPWHGAGRCEEVADAMHQACASVSEVGRGRWSFTIDGGRFMTGSAWAEDSWLTMESADGSAPERLRGTNAWRLLQTDGNLPARTKIVPSKARRLHVRFELLLDGNTDLHAGIARGCDGLTDALRILGEEEKAASRKRARRWNARNKDVDVAEVCAEAGWLAATRDGVVSARLEVPGRFHLAKIACTRFGDLRASTDLLHGEEVPDVSRRALGVFLLRLNDTVRFVRAAAAEDQGEVGVILEGFADPECASEVKGTLDAMSVACRISSEEVIALQDEKLAVEYLRRCGIPVRVGSGKRAGSAAS